MSEQATSYVWQLIAAPDDPTPAPAMLTLLCIAWQADDDGVLQRSPADLAADRGIEVRALTRQEVALREQGHLEVEEGKKTHTYTVRLFAPKEAEEQFELEVQSCPEQPLPKITIDRHALNAEEWKLAQRTMAVFNECNGSRQLLVGSRGGATEALKRIVCRIREHPELTGDDMEQLVRNNFANPWWKEPQLKGVGPIFGPKAWARALANTGKRPTGKKKSYERDRSKLKDPGW